jgi:hypothetical protein
MKIVFLLPSLNFSGGVKAVIQIANGLKEKGHDVSIYAPRFPERSWHVNFGWKLKYIEPKVPVVMYISNIQIPKNVDIIIATSWETAYTLDQLYEKRKDFVPVYFIQHIETWDYYNTNEMSENDHLALNTYTFPFHKIITSDWLAKYVCTPYKVPMGIEPVPDIPESEWRNPFYRENPIIVGILRGIPWKGDDIILKLAEEYPIQTYKNLSNEVLDSVLWRADIFISASLVEGFNLPVLEAMAHGCCCISTDVGAVREYSNNYIGVLLADRNSRGFSMVLDHLQKNPEDIREISGIAKELSKEWTIQRTIDKFEDVLKDVTRQK